MIERKEVEALLAACERDYIGPHPDNDTLAALCRAWLAVEDAPVATLSRNDIDALALPDTWSGQRVRIVPVEGGE